MTEAEEILWKQLRRKKLGGMKFYRQVPIDRFIADFYCPSQKLVIEVDGSIHDLNDVVERDLLRTQCFRKRGLRILRIRNEEIFTNIQNVCDRIAMACSSRIK